MKNIFLLACVLLFSGCGVKYPETANINLQIHKQSATVYTNTAASVSGYDARDYKEVVIFKVKKEPVVKVENQNPPHIVITERLTGGLRAQGLKFVSNSPVRIVLELNQLLVTVTKPKLLYNSEAVSQVTLKVTNRETSLERTYNRQDNRESGSRPKIADIEKMMNDQLSTMVDKILADKEVREIISKM